MKSSFIGIWSNGWWPPACYWTFQKSSQCTTTSLWRRRYSGLVAFSFRSSSVWSATCSWCLTSGDWEWLEPISGYFKLNYSSNQYDIIVFWVNFKGWGGAYIDEPISKILSDIQQAETVQMDRWRLTVTKNVDSSAVCDDRGEDVLPLNVVNNYFSLGVDAQIALQVSVGKWSFFISINLKPKSKSFKFL